MKISHIQGHVCLRAAKTERHDVLFSKLVLYCYWRPVLQCIHAWFVIASLIMLPEVFPTLTPLPLVNPPTPSHVKLSNSCPPQCASCTHSFTLKRDTWTFRGWQRASPLQINRSTCGLWKWGFLCYCFTKWSFSPQSSSYLIYPTPCHLQHTHTSLSHKYMQTDTPPLPPPSAVTHTHTLPVTSIESVEQMVVWRKCCLSSMFVLFTAN